MVKNHRRFLLFTFRWSRVLRGYACPAVRPACYQYPNLLNKPSSLLREIKKHNNGGAALESVQTRYGSYLLERKTLQNTGLALNMHVALRSEMVRSSCWTSRGANKLLHFHACHTPTHLWVEIHTTPVSQVCISSQGPPTINYQFHESSINFKTLDGWILSLKH